MSFLEIYKKQIVPIYEQGHIFIPSIDKYTPAHFREWADELKSVKEPLAEWYVKQLTYMAELAS